MSSLADLGLSAAALSVWGKTSNREVEHSMALARHLLDSADVATDVWDWLPQRTRTTICEGFDGSDDDGRTLLRWLAGVHDIGKCSPPFAAQVPVLADAMHEQGLRIGRDQSEFSTAKHGLVGHAILARWLGERFDADRRASASLAVIVGGHHGVPPTMTQLQFVKHRPHLVGTGTWEQVQDELLDAMSRHLGAGTVLASLANRPLPPTAQALLTGAVIVSDWLASNPELFGFNDDRDDRADSAWQDVGLPAPWVPAVLDADVTARLHARFPHLQGVTPQPVQKLAAEVAANVDGPSMLIIEAAMGTGKTEAALLAAETLAARFGCGGVFVALPTMSTTDAMFDRVHDWIENLDQEVAVSTFLAHGKAGLNDAFAGLVQQSHAVGIYDEVADGHAEARVLSWLTGRKKGVLASMVVGTIDQLLFMSLQARHLALRHLAFSGKVVVIDEAHAADAYMRVFLERALEWLAAYGVPVILLSATLPRATRQALADAYRRGLGLSVSALPADEPYPALTVVGSGIEVLKPVDAQQHDARDVEVRCLDDDLDTLVGTVRDLLADGGCVAVIRNTVGRAQESAAELRSALPDVDVVLHHSRFIATHRAEKEAVLRRELGRAGDARPARQVLVGTQVLEQSLDVDFDAMVTDLAPADLILQRVGRLHRHSRGEGESDRPASLRRPRLYVTGVAEWGDDGLPVPVRASRYVYPLAWLLRGAATLQLDPIAPRLLSLPASIRPVVEAAYADDPPGAEAGRRTIADADSKLTLDLAAQRKRAEEYCIASVADLDRGLIGWLEYDGGSEAEDDRGTASRVRDSEDGLEVIVVQRRADGVVVYIDDPGNDLSGVPVVPDLGPPRPDVARALAATTVRLPMSLTNESAINAVLDALEADAHEGWQDSRWLSGQLALHLDDDWTCELGDWRVVYDRNQGLTAARTDA